MINMQGSKHKGCRGGRYEETSIHDDWDGVLHCIKCGDRIEHYIYTPEEQEEQAANNAQRLNASKEVREAIYSGFDATIADSWQYQGSLSHAEYLDIVRRTFGEIMSVQREMMVGEYLKSVDK